MIGKYQKDKKRHFKELIKSEVFWISEEINIVTDNSFNKIGIWQYLLLEIYNE